MNHYSKLFYRFFCVLALLVMSCTVHALDHKGMALGLFAKDMNYSYENDLREMKKLGVTHILLVVSWYQLNVNANEIRPLPFNGQDNSTIPDSKLREVIRQANQMGIKSMLFPILRIEVRKGKDWRGVIAPTDLNAWWQSYEKFVLHYLQIATQEGVPLFSVGSELLSREKDTAQWKNLIQKVRLQYKGKLVYSSNWDHYQYPEFWEMLDYIGVTAYHELTKTKTPTLEQLKQGWVKIKNDLLMWKAKYPKQKLLFTEVGYSSVDGVNIYPWNYFLDGPIDLEEQALCYQALYDTWVNVPQLGGVYFWVWWGDGGPQDRGYSPRNKPAAEWVKKWYLPIAAKR